MRHALLLILAAAAGIAAVPPPPGPDTALRLRRAEEAFADLRDLEDATRLASSRGVSRPPRSGETEATARRRLKSALEGLEPASLDAEDARALAAMRQALEASQEDSTGPALPDPCAYDPEALATSAGALDALRRRMYACFGLAARAIAFDGESLDRLSVLARLGTTADPDLRKRLFMALAPVWRTVNGDGSPSSPFRRMLPLSAARWKASGSPVEENLRALDVAPDVMESWLTSMLEAWRLASPETPVEPWDFRYATEAAGRRLAARLPVDRLAPVNAAFHRSLGADLSVLPIRFDLDSRPGKTPVAFTDFGRRPRWRNRWVPGEAWVFATYRAGGLGNLTELLHETGHAIHISAIRTRPAFADWPEGDAYSEALGDLIAMDAYEPEWQERYVGAAAPLADSIREKYAGIILDVCWALFELRLHRDPSLDPNQAWTAITSEYLKITPHRELSWWATRGQLVHSPGYMMNYALGAIIAADLRARCRELRGPFFRPDPGYYAWLSERLYRFGRERATGRVIADFLGRPLSPRSLIQDLGRAGASGPGASR